MERAKQKTFADVLVLAVSLLTIGRSIWGPALLTQASQDRGASATYFLSLIAGALGLLGLGIAQKRPSIGRWIVAVAGVVVLIGPFTYQRLAPLPMTFAILSGLLLLLGARFIGPLPPPEKHI
jgi:hypothetical protein